MVVGLQRIKQGGNSIAVLSSLLKGRDVKLQSWEAEEVQSTNRSLGPSATATATGTTRTKTKMTSLAAARTKTSKKKSKL